MIRRAITSNRGPPSARMLSGQGRGRKYRELKRVYQLFFVNGILFPQNSRVPRRYFLMEEQDHDILTGVLEIIFCELPKLEAKVRAYCEGRKDLQGFSEEEKWCIYLKYRHETQAADLIAELCRKETGIMSVETVLKRVSRDEEQWAKQLFREKAAMDYRSGMGAARDEGLAKGRTIGRKEGIAIGDARGFERARMETGRSMKADGFSTEQIRKYTGLPVDAIREAVGGKSGALPAQQPRPQGVDRTMRPAVAHIIPHALPNARRL